MQRLIEDLLQYSRLATHGRPFEEVDLDETLAGVLDDLSGEIERTGAQVTAAPLGMLRADPVQMRQLLQNLVSNALKFHRPDVEPEVRIDATRDERSVRISVQDNGIGFDPRYSQRIFRVFERLNGRSDFPGTGIGLALCRKIAERHQGAIVAEGELDRGARFTVALPLCDAPGEIRRPPVNEKSPGTASHEEHAVCAR
jgi:signal transduction histidine kinase